MSDSGRPLSQETSHSPAMASLRSVWVHRSFSTYPELQGSRVKGDLRHRHGGNAQPREQRRHMTSWKHITAEDSPGEQRLQVSKVRACIIVDRADVREATENEGTNIHSAGSHREVSHTQARKARLDRTSRLGGRRGQRGNTRGRNPASGR